MEKNQGGSYMMKPETRLYAFLTLIGAIIGGAVVTQLGASAAMAAGHVRTLSAEQFVLLDRDGTQRAVMKVAPDGTTHLAMFDGHKRDRADFRVTRDGAAAIGFYDQKGSPRVLVGASIDGRNGLAIYSTGGKQIASLSVTENNEASLTLYDPNTGMARAGLGTGPNGTPALALFDQGGTDRAEIHVRANGKGGLVLVDENNKAIRLPEPSTTTAQR
jgi:hypothetical protein